MRKKVMNKTVLMGMCLAVFCVGLFCDCGLSSAEPKVGDVYDKSNWQDVADYVSPAIVHMIKTQGLVIRVGENREYPFSKGYMEATEKYKGTVKLGEDGSLIGFQAGLPFPDIDMNDPDAGLKCAWNHEVRSQPEQRYYHKFNFVWINKKGKIERTATGRDRKIYYIGRIVNPPTPTIPNKEGFNYKEILYFYDPKDVAGVGFVVWRFLDPKKDDHAWAYVPAARRVRRMSSGMTTDAYLGSDITIDDFDGFSAKPPQFKWKLLGKKKMLVMRTVEQFQNYRGGIGWCPEPDRVFWQLRPVYETEAIPLKKGHPYSKIKVYLDAHRFQVPYSEQYDKQGKLWKTWLQAWLWHEDWNWFTWAGGSIIDHQALHATLVGAFCKPQNPGYTERMFTMEELERLGH